MQFVSTRHFLISLIIRSDNDFGFCTEMAKEMQECTDHVEAIKAKITISSETEWIWIAKISYRSAQESDRHADENGDPRPFRDEGAESVEKVVNTTAYKSSDMLNASFLTLI